MEENIKNDVDKTEDVVMIDDDDSTESSHYHSEHHHSHHSHHSHHHSHHHSSHHSHSKRRHSRKSKDIKYFFKKNKYKIANISVSVLVVVLLVTLGISLDKKGFTNEGDLNSENAGSFSATDSSLKIEIPLFADDAVLVSTGVEKYINSVDIALARDYYKDYSALGRQDSGKPVTLWYEINGMPVDYSVKSTELLISEKDDFSSPIVYSVESDETSVDVYNLKTGKKYFYRFELTFTNGSKTGVNGSFDTAPTPRMLNVDGVGNIRDIGGWTTVDGKKIRQGMLFRGTELDGLVEPKYTATADGINTLLTVLGVRTEMDLRHESDNPNKINVLGAGVKHNYYGIPMYSEVFTDNGKAIIRGVFSDLADKNNYPVYMHCTHGMDRTGTVCYLLEAILGMNEDDLMREYQLSVFYHGTLWSINEMNEFIGRLKAYEGTTIQQKAENFLISTGVTANEIASIREIFLEG